MCNPRVINGPNCIKEAVRKPDNMWDGPVQMYEVLSPFLFGKDHSPDNVSAESALSALREENDGGCDAVLHFLRTVQARTIVNIARTHPEDFLRQWCAVDRETYEGWETLDMNCLSREDLDLLYVGFSPRKFYPRTLNPT